MLERYIKKLARGLAWILLTAVCITSFARVQDPCPHGTAEDTANAFEEALAHAKSCKSAVDLYQACLWGSSADSEFGAITIKRCEKTFYNKLSPAGQDHYGEEMQLCAYEFSRQQGSMYISAAASCQVNVAAKFAAHPTLADQPLPHASFDCDSAKGSYEDAACSNVALGHADLVLARVLKGVLLNLSPSDQRTLTRNQQQWLHHITAKCHLAGKPFAASQLNCTRNEIELRFSDLDSCQDGDQGIANCLWKSGASSAWSEDFTPMQREARASFDCEVPATALQIVICADSELGQQDIKLDKTYRDVGTELNQTQRDELATSQSKWLKFVRNTCPLGPIGGIPPALTRACVRSAYRYRTKQIEACSDKEPGKLSECLNNFKILEKDDNTE